MFVCYFSGLRDSLQREFIGQHIAQDLIHFTISAHLENPAPSKPLVLSLHGFPKAEKEQIFESIADSMYFRGVDSKYIRAIGIDKPFVLFRNESFLQHVVSIVRQIFFEVPSQPEDEKGCYTSLHIFDAGMEPMKILNGLFQASFRISQPDYNKHIFIIFTSVGAKEIRDISYKNWKIGNKRENLDYKHFHKMLKHVTYKAPACNNFNWKFF